jgi:hypothetical protein
MKKKLGFRYSKQRLWNLFLVVAFPIHFWALILWFQEFNMMAQRTNTWDAIGEGGYFLSYALFESSVIFSVLFLLMLLLPKKLEQETAFALAATFYLIIAGWFILEQARFLEVMPDESWLFIRLQRAITLQSNTGKLLAIALITSLVIPPILILKYDKLRTAVTSVFERIGTLSLLYLLLDVIGIVIVLIRII